MMILTNPDLFKEIIKEKRNLYIIYGCFLSALIVSSIIGFLFAIIFLPKSELKDLKVNPKSGQLLFPDPIRESDFKIILKRNLFNSEASAEEGSQVCEFTKSSLPVKVMGIIYGGRGDRSLAVVQASLTQEWDTFVIGESIPGDALIQDIEYDRVIIKRGQCLEFLELEKPEPYVPKNRKSKVETAEVSGDEYREDGFERVGDKANISRQWLDKVLSVDFAKTLQDAKANPYMEGNEIKGFSLEKIHANSVYEKLGLKNGDIVTEINGIPLNDASRAIQTLNAMKQESQISLKVKRDKQDVNYQVNVK